MANTMSIQSIVRYASTVWLRRLLLMLSVAGMLGACSLTPREYSREDVTLSAATNQQIAEDVAGLLLNQYPLETTTFVVHRDRRGDRFGRALEAQLRRTGYAIAVDHHNGKILVYLLDQLTAGLYRVDIRVEPTDRMGLVYRLNKDGSLVLSSVTVRGDLGRVFSGDKAPDKINSDTPTSDSVTRIGTVNGAGIDNRAVFLGIDREQAKTNPVAVAPVVISKPSKPWAVQVISLSADKTGVLDAIKRRVEAMGYEAYIAETDSAKKIRVGPYESLAAVRPVLYQMRANGYPDAFLWKQDKEKDNN